MDEAFPFVNKEIHFHVIVTLFITNSRVRGVDFSATLTPGWSYFMLVDIVVEVDRVDLYMSAKRVVTDEHAVLVEKCS